MFYCYSLTSVADACQVTCTQLLHVLASLLASSLCSVDETISQKNNTLITLCTVRFKISLRTISLIHYSCTIYDDIRQTLLVTQRASCSQSTKPRLWIKAQTLTTTSQPSPAQLTPNDKTTQHTHWHITYWHSTSVQFTVSQPATIRYDGRV